jgi:ferredoxin-nitrite reductase
VPDSLVAVFERFKEERRDGERFHEWARRTRNEELRETLRGLTPVASRRG